MVVPGAVDSLIREYLHQVEARKETAVIHDPKGALMREFFRPERGDVVIDPGLAQCCYWAMERECRTEMEAASWAKTFLPDHAGEMPFFLKVPRSILAVLMSRYSAWNEPENPVTAARMGYWLANGEKEILPRLKGTEHYRSLNRGGKDTPEVSDQSQGLYSTLGDLAPMFRMLPESPEGRAVFAVREWREAREGWIFLASAPVRQTALKPLHAAIVDLAILWTQQVVHDRYLPRVHFILDEVATMGRIDQLLGGVTKQRESGNPIVLGVS